MREVFKEADAEMGISTTVHADESRVVLQKTYDAEPLLEYAKGLREATQGKTWGDGRIVGTVPMAVLSQYLRRGLNGKELAKELTAWVRANPAMICFDKFK